MKTKTNDSEKQIAEYKKNFIATVKIEFHKGANPTIFFYKGTGRGVAITGLQFCNQKKTRSMLLNLPGEIMPDMKKAEYIKFMQIVKDNASILE
jgi:hypothetical protein